MEEVNEGRVTMGTRDQMTMGTDTVTSLSLALQDS